jgi:malonyl CoA-acyl carrier protein transacylase
MTRIFVFPGQGSQIRGMGRDLLDAYPEIVATADGILGYSLRQLCLDDPKGQLANTAFTQPALFTVNALAAMRRMEELGDTPHFAAGHSLGEYNALLVAEAFDFATGLRLVQERGRLMAELRDGGMAAVIGPERAAIQDAFRSTGIETVDIANLNTPAQTVLSGPKADLDRLAPAIERLGGRLVPLNVTTAFHSRYVRAIKAPFAEFVAGCRLQPLMVPVVANFTALPYRDDEVAHNLVQQIDHGVRWVESVQYLLQEPEPEFEELGPGQALTRMIAEIRRHPVPLGIARRY